METKVKVSSVIYKGLVKNKIRMCLFLGVVFMTSCANSMATLANSYRIVGL